jgi:hypothetical protein
LDDGPLDLLEARSRRLSHARQRRVNRTREKPLVRGLRRLADEAGVAGKADASSIGASEDEFDSANRGFVDEQENVVRMAL